MLFPIRAIREHLRKEGIKVVQTHSTGESIPPGNETQLDVYGKRSRFTEWFQKPHEVSFWQKYSHFYIVHVKHNINHYKIY